MCRGFGGLRLGAWGLGLKELGINGLEFGA